MCHTILRSCRSRSGSTWPDPAVATERATADAQARPPRRIVLALHSVKGESLSRFGAQDEFLPPRFELWNMTNLRKLTATGASATIRMTAVRRRELSRVGF